MPARLDDLAQMLSIWFVAQPAKFGIDKPE